MLKTIELKDFQRHSSLSIELDPKVTTIVGPTDRGKSAIIRMISWVARNQPTGSAMIKHGKKRALGKLVFDDCVVIRKKGEGTNVYLLDGRKYKAFGAGKVPDEVKAAIALDDVNFQMQLDGHFWFSDSPGTVSRQLNQVVDLAIIDSSLAAAQSELRDAAAERKVSETRLEKASLEKARLGKVPALLASLQELGKLEGRLEEERRQFLAIADLVSSMATLDNEIEPQEKTAKEATMLAKQMKTLLDELGEMQDFESLLTEAEEAESLSKQAIPDTAELRSRFVQLEASQNEALKLQALIDKIKKEDRCVCQAASSLTEAETELKRESKNRCPLCQSQLS